MTARTRLITRIPAPFGYSAALEVFGSAAAPMLTGFAFVLIGLIIQNAKDFGQPNVALVLLVLAALLLINAVQFTFKARQYYIPPDEFVSLMEIGKSDGFSEDILKDWYSKWLPRLAKNLHRARLLYNGGVVLLLVGVGVALIPRGPLSHANPVRLTAASLVFAGAVFEGLLTLLPSVSAWIRERREELTKRDQGEREPKESQPDPTGQAEQEAPNAACIRRNVARWTR